MKCVLAPRFVDLSIFNILFWRYVGLQFMQTVSKHLNRTTSATENVTSETPLVNTEI
jgi:hypothetical protein